MVWVAGPPPLAMRKTLHTARARAAMAVKCANTNCAASVEQNFCGECGRKRPAPAAAEGDSASQPPPTPLLPPTAELISFAAEFGSTEGRADQRKLRLEIRRTQLPSTLAEQPGGFALEMVAVNDLKRDCAFALSGVPKYRGKEYHDDSGLWCAKFELVDEEPTVGFSECLTPPDA